MIINFRQGIISAQSNQFINLNEGKVNINANTKSVDIAFAYGQANYLFSEVEDVSAAWGPFNSGTDYWLYWNIDLRTGLRTYGSTTVAPSYGAVLPASPQLDQHFFDTKEKKMKVWNGTSWDYKLRVFAGNVQGGSTLVAFTTGSQVGISGSYPIGYILFDSTNNPVKRNDLFVTTEDRLHTQYDSTNSYKLDGLLIDGTAMESIPAYYCVSWKGARQIGITSNVTYQYPCIGISAEPSAKNEVTKFITKGMVTNFNNWNWSEPANTPLFVGPNGEITTTVPNSYSLQKIGHIVSPDTIFIDIQELILIDEIYVPVTPSPTPSLSASPTPSLTASPTPSPSLSQMISNQNVDMVSVFYQRKGLALALSPQILGDAQYPSTIRLTAFDGTNIIDIGESNVSWAINGDGSEAIGTKSFRKLRGFSNYLSVNVPNDYQPSLTDDLVKSVVYDGTVNAYSGGISNERVGMFATESGQPLFTHYAIDNINNLQYTIYNTGNYTTSYNILTCYYNGTALTSITSGLPSNIDYFGFCGLDVLSDGTAFTLGYDSSTSTYYFIKIIASGLNTTENTINITYDVQSIPYSMPISYISQVEIYETKAFNNIEFISFAGTPASNGQTYSNTCNDNIYNMNSVQPFILYYDHNTNQLFNFYFDSYALGYMTITDQYMFVPTPNLDGTFDFKLSVYDMINGGALVDMIHVSSIMDMPAVDMRLRSVRTNSNTITIYTFGGGIFTFDGTTLLNTGLPDVFDAITELPSGGCTIINNAVIDTWAGKMQSYPLPSPSVTPTMTPTPTPTPSSLPPPVYQNDFTSGMNGITGAWTIVDDTTYGKALGSNDITDNQSTAASLTLNLANPATLRFSYKVDSEQDYDMLIVAVDGTQILSISGKVDWTIGSFPISTSGSHTITWTYSKDSSNSVGQDMAWVANIYIY